jgi:hypothetical protein
MGRASSSKKVARASKVAGRSKGRSTNFVWPAAVAAVVVLGVILVVVSRGNGGTANAAGLPTFGDHWHAAYGVYDCDKFLAPFADAKDDVLGIHTHQDGLIHIHPFEASATGKNANLATFGKQVNMELSDTRLKLPDGTVLKNGGTCGGKAAQLELWAWDEPGDATGHKITKDLAQYRPKDQSMVVIAFVADGTQIPRPPSSANLDDPLAAEEGRQTPVQAGTGSTTTAPGAATTTIAPPGSSTTTTAAK